MMEDKPFRNVCNCGGKKDFRNCVTHAQLMEAASALHQMLCEYGNPHTTITITQAFVNVMQDEMGVPLPVPD